MGRIGRPNGSRAAAREGFNRENGPDFLIGRGIFGLVRTAIARLNLKPYRRNPP
jgi:hypothetical protein